MKPSRQAPKQVSNVKSLIGPGVRIVGEVSGQDDIRIDGVIEGSVSLPEHNLHIGVDAKLKAEVRAKTVMIDGSVEGDIKSTERVAVTRTGRIKGDVYAPRMTLDDGANLCGRVDMDLESVSKTNRPTPAQAPVK